MYKDYKTTNGKWITFRPLPLIKREELSKRFNSFNKFVPINHQVLENDYLEYNLRQILLLYNLDLDNFDINEIDNLLIDYIVKVNFRESEVKKQKIEDLVSQGGNNKKSNDSEMDIIPQLLSSLWGLCDNAGDAIYMLDKLPADTLLDTIKYRSEALELMYMSEDDKKKKEQKKLKEELMKKSTNRG